MRAIIIAAGEATRWKNHTGTTKHFAVLNGQPIIHRTIDLLRANGVAYDDIYIVSKDYNLPYGNNYHIVPNYEQNGDADKFLSSADLWAKDQRTVIIYGDVYFSEKAMHRIVHYQNTGWRLFCRPTASAITGTKWGECFAIQLYPQHHQLTLDKLHHIAMLHRTGAISRCGGWELARAMMNKPDNKIRHPHVLYSPLYVVIDDETDDIDYPDDYDRLKQVLANAN